MTTHSVNGAVNHSLIGSCLIHWGNGREWKGMEEEGKSRSKTAIISSSYVPVSAREAASPSPTESRHGMMPLREGWAA